ncbi:hypothetical protein [Halostagnicola sp. A-GB9-2]|uniref:hypothetical protein n=1 Tax=Halostagnicola sp. A-GB9-2 TaxID=3048066 RepID=UPI0024C0995B|nr:hypothetical protein [Halostagnicola sp. A-GB9-2]MDJ1432022.1 hypothetical protein [Halostagnicola sp. A-GB9-2]
MNGPSTETHPLLGADERARILRSLLFSVSLTPILLLIEPARRIVSLEATVAAIGLGIFFGIVAAIGLADINLQDANSVTASIVVLVCICVATIVVWLIVPHRHIGTVLQFTVAFIWAMPITELLYQTV